MKFTDSLQQNIIPEWSPYYLNYKKLKDIIYQMEKLILVGNSDTTELQDQFQQNLKSDVSRIQSFYHGKEQKLIADYNDLLPQLTSLKSSDIEKGIATQEYTIIKEEIKNLFHRLVDLENYLVLNQTGFRKILKKHDKCTHLQLMSQMMPKIEDDLHVQDQVKDMFEAILKYFSKIFCCDNRSLALSELQRELSQQIKFTRATIWHDMMEKEKTKTDKSPTNFFERQSIKLGFAFMVFAIVYFTPFKMEQSQKSCLAMFLFVSILWATEAFPLFVTAILIPFMAVTLHVLKDKNGEPISAKALSAHIFSTMFSHVVMLLLGGFSIAAALSKYNIAKSLAITVLSKSGTKPSSVLLANMFVATFLSMWISNVAAPVLCYSIARPILRSFSSDSNFAKSVVIGIALAANIGGMASPISSPQNVFAIDEMSNIVGVDSPGWLEWFAVAIPTCIVADLVCWVVLVLIYRPNQFLNCIAPIRKSKEEFTWKHYIISITTISTIILWCLNNFLKKWTGEMGVLAIIPFFIFFGFGILQKEDLNSFPWSIVLLAEGGLVLGDCVSSSGLLKSISINIQHMISGSSLWVILLIFCLLIMIFTSFVSHSVGAIVILPIVRAVGESLESGSHPRLLIFGSVLMCSCAMALPVSGFPNMTAVSLEDSNGKAYLKTNDFIKVGLPCTVLCLIIIVSISFGILTALGY